VMGRRTLTLGCSELGREAAMKRFLRRLWQDEQGQDLTEYALLMVLIALAAVAAMGTLGNAINNAFSDVMNALSGTK
jgi:pilus assembly protein Flp/PilA